MEADFEHLEVHVQRGEKVVKLQEQNADPAVQEPSAETAGKRPHISTSNKTQSSRKQK